MFIAFKALLLGKLKSLRAAFTSGSGSAMVAAVAGLLDSVFLPEAARDLRTIAEGLDEAGKAKEAKATFKLFALAANAAFGLEGSDAITVSAIAHDGDCLGEIDALVAKCEPTVGTAALAGPAAFLTPDQRKRWGEFLGAILRGFVGQ